MKLGVLASWRGTNFKAILDHIRLDVLKGVEPAVLIYSDEKAPVREIAEKYGVEAVFVKHRGVPRGQREREMIEVLKGRGVDVVALAGYDYVLSKEFIESFNLVLNIHPSLLPFAGGKGMYGMRVHMEIYRAGVKVTGPTVHVVDESVDGGPIVDQWPVYIADVYTLPLSTEEKVQIIADRVLIFEHRLYSRVLQAVADGLLEFREERVKAPRVVEEGGKIKVEEVEIVVKRALLRVDEAWRRAWEERQRIYVEYQLKEWATKPLHLILPPWLRG
ncbi:formyltransferase family protein [Pyrobaculum sp.]|uniref:phosphoribosylglycinamide formyltransferase n=1 Tax=Pyrobaculum sp. TaxID=2004705 RepID=UPI003162E748